MSWEIYRTGIGADRAIAPAREYRGRGVRFAFLPLALQLPNLTEAQWKQIEASGYTFGHVVRDSGGSVVSGDFLLRSEAILLVRDPGASERRISDNIWKLLRGAIAVLRLRTTDAVYSAAGVFPFTRPAMWDGKMVVERHECVPLACHIVARASQRETRSHALARLHASMRVMTTPWMEYEDLYAYPAVQSDMASGIALAFAALEELGLNYPGGKAQIWDPAKGFLPGGRARLEKLFYSAGIDPGWKIRWVIRGRSRRRKTTKRHPFHDPEGVEVRFRPGFYRTHGYRDRLVSVVDAYQHAHLLRNRAGAHGGSEKADVPFHIPLLQARDIFNVQRLARSVLLRSMNVWDAVNPDPLLADGTAGGEDPNLPTDIVPAFAVPRGTQSLTYNAEAYAQQVRRRLDNAERHAQIAAKHERQL